MCVLVALTYVKAWSRATRAEQAKHVDSESLQDIETMQIMRDDVVVIDVAKQVQVTMKHTSGRLLLRDFERFGILRI